MYDLETNNKLLSAVARLLRGGGTDKAGTASDEEGAHEVDADMRKMERKLRPWEEEE